MAKFRFLSKSVIRNSQGLYLLLWRSSDDESSPGRVDLPGGGIEVGESPEDAAIREAQEEVGLKLDRKFVKHLYASTKVSDDGTIVVRNLFFSTSESMEVVLSPEHSSFEWVEKNDFVKYFSETSWNEAIEFADKHRLM